MLEPVDFCHLTGFDTDNLAEAFAAFQRSARHFRIGCESLRAARPLPPEMPAIYAAALATGGLDTVAARNFFAKHFTPFRVNTPNSGFLTGYYEPVVAASRTPDADFAAPIYARPPDLLTLTHPVVELGDLAAARQNPDGSLSPYPKRAQIEAEASQLGLQPVVYLRDLVEVFLIQVQGSARVQLPDGQSIRLRYDGRNGHAYTSIGRLLIKQGAIKPEDMSLAALKAWLRARGLKPGEAGRTLMQRNESYVFFTADITFDLDSGPIGGEGVPLTPLRSLAVDRSLWNYGLPFWIEANLPWRQHSAPESFARLMIAQDTGSAIIGAARGDLFFGSGENAGTLAGNIRHPASFTVLMPKSSA